MRAKSGLRLPWWPSCSWWPPTYRPICTAITLKRRSCSFFRLLAVVALFAIVFFIRQAQWLKAWFSSAVFIVLVTLFGVTGMYPNLLISSIDPAFSLSAFNSSSSPLTLKIMLAVALVFVPTVIAYQIWVYWLFGKGGQAAAPKAKTA